VKIKLPCVLFFACSHFLAGAQTPPADIFSYFRAPGKPGKMEIIQDAAIQARVNGSGDTAFPFILAPGRIQKKRQN
jgi:hypothetical protein